MREGVSIDLVLLLRNPRAQEELGEALWAAFREVEGFYNWGVQRAEFHRLLLSEQQPSERVLQHLEENSSGATPRPLWLPAPPSLWGMAESSQVRTYEADEIGTSVRALLGDALMGTPLIVTDQELTPPPQWRYILWKSRVVSLAPMDPDYWRTRDSHRVATIKHRVRTVCLLNVGSVLGMGRCSNEHCFLYRNVDSVTRLDAMVKLGPEHSVSELQDRGFEVISDEPRAVQRVQPVTGDAMQWGWAYER